MSLLAIYQSVSVLACGLYTGASIYINVGEHPARLAAGTRLAATVFPGSLKRGGTMQVLLVLLTTIASVLAWSVGAGFNWLLAGLLLFSVVPFSLIAIIPTNKQLLNPQVDKESPHTKALLEKWGMLHAVRSVAGLISFLWFLSQLNIGKN